jgi:hypothetical protein
MSLPRLWAWEAVAWVVEDTVFNPLATNVCCMPTRFDLPTKAFLAESPVTEAISFQLKYIIGFYITPHCNTEIEYLHRS